MTDFRRPNITGSTDKEQLQHLKNYLCQLVDQLNWAFETLEKK